MIYITGDKHGDSRDVFEFCNEHETTTNDILIVLGDAGFNYYMDGRNFLIKELVEDLPIKLFCIHGNHEERPENIKTYKQDEFHGGIVYYEEFYPNILFAKDGEVYDFNGNKTLVIGGAYSVDKDYRIAKGINWYPSEQPNEVIKEKVLNVLKEHNYEIDVILSHTCPLKYTPYEEFKGGIDQSKVDKSTERFLDFIEENTNYKKWYCGHYHTDKTIDRIRFMLHDIEEFKTLEKDFERVREDK